MPFPDDDCMLVIIRLRRPFQQRGEDWVILAGDRNQARSIVKMKTDEDKMRVLGPHQVMAFNGEAGEYEHTAIADQVIAQAADAS